MKNSIIFAVILGLFLTACQASDQGSADVQVETAPNNVPFSQGPDGPPDVDGPSGPPPSNEVIKIEDPQAVTQKENIKVTLPVTSDENQI